MKHIVMFSGGVGSWAAARRVVARHGPDDVVLLFADTKMEDPDLYRFLHEAVANIGAQLEIIADGRNPWEVFTDKRWLGNSRRANCSILLKQAPCRAWLEERFGPGEATVYVGIDWTEIHRLEGIRPIWAPWPVEAPMCESPYLAKQEMLADLEAAGIEVPRLYKLGFAHNNCGGGCVKGGIAHWLHLLKTMPERYRWHEEQEQALREYLGKDVAILTDRSGGGRRPLTLRELRLTRGCQLDVWALDDWGGCGCFMEEQEESCSLNPSG